MSAMAGAKRTEVFLDRIEEGTAIVVFGEDDARELPASVLPKGAREGDRLTLSLEIDEEATRRERDEVAALRKRLGEGDDGGDLSL